MAQIKNNFVKSKMNKDLDDRLLQPGEYRDATNVNISRSEGDDVGALENVLGNNLNTIFAVPDINIQIIGYYANSENNSVIAFATDYTDESETNLSNPAPYGANCYIFYKKLIGAGSPSFGVQTLVSGRFLNFSKTHKILSCDVVEDLLFWTDDRNQPRVINWKRALSDPTYYYNEDHVSVSKYYPWQAPILQNEVTINGLTWWDTGWPGEGDINISTYYKISDKPTIDKLRVGMEVASYTNGGNDYYAFPKFRAFIVERYAPATLPAGEDYWIKINIEPFPVTPNIADSPFVPYFVGAQDNYNLNEITFIAASSQDKFSRYLFPHQYIRGNISFAADGLSFVSRAFSADEVLPGMQLTNPKDITNPAVITVVQETLNAQGTIIEYEVTVDRALNADGNNADGGTYFMVNWFNPNYNSSWPGDQQQMQDKFIRFAYRFKFDDGEYSLISPFTQPAFIPKQNGYVVTEPVPVGVSPTFANQEISIASTTTIKSFENSVNNVDVHLSFEYPCDQLAGRLKVKEVDILYRESDQLAISVLETIPIEDESFSSNTSNTYVYDYQSKKPFRVLPEAETIRVFDKVPVRAKTQSVTGNRVIYGNIVNKHTPPITLDYSVAISEKYTPGDYSKIANNYTDVNKISTIPATSYPYHTVKQNRNYQVGVVLSDRYGRQSDVILSSITSLKQGQTGQTEEFDGDTVYHPYPNNADELIPANWRGDSIKVLFNLPVPETRSDAEGYPGIFSPKTYTKVVSLADNPGEFVPQGVGNADKYGGIQVGDIFFATKNNGNEFMGVVERVVAEGDATYPNGVVKFQPSNIQMEEEDLNIVTFHSPGNQLGWYSYKIVVKQLVNDYYNLYLGQITTINSNAQVQDPTGAGASLFPFGFDSYCTSLISDNVNKVPADLQNVAPEQLQFGTSDVLLYPRIGAVEAPIQRLYGQQFYYGTKTASISAYGKMLDLGLQSISETETNKYPSSQGVWSASNNPTMIVLGMPDGESIGIKPSNTNGGAGGLTPSTIFAAMEVNAEPSRVDIYWETSTSGLVKELNNLITDGPTSDPIPQDPDPFLPPIIEK